MRNAARVTVRGGVTIFNQLYGKDVSWDWLSMTSVCVRYPPRSHLLGLLCKALSQWKFCRLPPRLLAWLLWLHPIASDCAVVLKRSWSVEIRWSNALSRLMPICASESLLPQWVTDSSGSGGIGLCMCVFVCVCLCVCVSVSFCVSVCVCVKITKVSFLLQLPLPEDHHSTLRNLCD